MSKTIITGTETSSKAIGVILPVLVTEMTGPEFGLFISQLSEAEPDGRIFDGMTVVVNKATKSCYNIYMSEVFKS